MTDGENLALAVSGNFDLMEVRRLEAQCTGAAKVSIDLANATWVDSEALAFLWSLHQKGTAVEVTNPPALLLRTLKALGLDSAFAELIVSPVNE